MLLRNSIDPASLENIGKGLYCLAMVFLAAILLSNWWLKRHPQHERFGMMMAKFQLAFGSIVNPIFSKSLQYLSLTFMTNLSRRAFYTGLSLIIVLMIVSTLFVTLKKTLEHFDRKSMLGREFFSNGSPNYRLSNDAYDAQRNTEAPTPELCIPTDIVESAYLPVFVKYPRSMDARLTKFCGNLNIADNSQLSKTAQRLITDSLNISCLSNFFQLRINDSINPPTDWLFTEKNGSKGIVTYLDTRSFPAGKNLLSVKIPTESKIDSLEQLGSLFFYFVPK